MKDNFLTVNQDGVFLGNVATTTYRGEKLDEYHIHNAQRSFLVDNDALAKKEKFAELYIMSSETAGLFSIAGKPSFKHGKHVWVRAKMLEGTVSDWTYLCELKNPSDAAKYAICSVMTGINLGVLFRKSKNQKIF